MYLEAVTVCVNYADFLVETAPFVRPHFDRWLIVTQPADQETQRLCHRLGLECLVTTDFRRDGATFDKAKGIDHALMLLTWKDWVLHLDADIALPGTFRESLEDAQLNRDCIYGCDRFLIRGFEQWQRFKNSSFFDRYSRCAHCNVCLPESMPLGSRWADIHQGYVPIGFFQLFHREAVMFEGIRQRRYAPHGHNDASRTDVQFALQWPRPNRQLLPEVVVGHLESQKGEVGINWQGRRSKPFAAIS